MPSFWVPACLATFGLCGCAASSPAEPEAAEGPSAAPVEVVAAPPAASAETVPAARSGQTTSIKLYFMVSDDPKESCEANGEAVRELSRDIEPGPAALAALLRGPTGDEVKRLRSPFTKSVSRPSAPPLSPQQVHLMMNGTTATVDFAKEAAPFLEQAMCARTAVTSAIEKTLLQLEGIKEVRFSIAGVVIEESDG